MGSLNVVRSIESNMPSAEAFLVENVVHAL